ncbi:formin-binding protein 1-like [Clytia hemisphaerica]|uniref:Uncharacterized protein n=1 Tax=Clytia hemisphaerica TaxID=252671 RepID=A0A7M5XEN2_9CNID
MATWGIDLWDQRDIVEKHTSNGIDFLERCASFVKERIRIEQEYAKSLRRLVKQYQFKQKKTEEILPYTYQQAFKQFLQETDDFAGQREVIAEETKNNVLNDMHNVASQSKNERKKALQNLNDLKSHLDQLQKALNVAKAKYEKASDDSNSAYKNYETATQSLDMTKAQILKFQKTSQDKKAHMDKCKDDYQNALENFNKTQQLYYQADFPNTVMKELQTPEENRVQKLANYFKEMSNIMRKVQPIITACLDGMVKAGDTCDPGKDSLTVIDRNKTGEYPPHDLLFEEWGKPHGSTNSLAPSPHVGGGRSKKAGKSTRGKTEKSQIIDPNIADTFSELPIAQREKKYNQKIHELTEQIAHEEKSMAALMKMKDTTASFGGDGNTMQDQFNASDKEIKRLKNLLSQYQAYLDALKDSRNPRPVSTISTASTNDFPPPPVAKQPELQQHQNVPPPPSAEQAPPPPPPLPAQGEFQDEFDDIKCSVLYDFGGSNEGEMTVFAGEELVITEDDDGGWTRVIRGDEEGYIPTSYIQKI